MIIILLTLLGGIIGFLIYLEVVIRDLDAFCKYLYEHVVNLESKVQELEEEINSLTDNKSC